MKQIIILMTILLLVGCTPKTPIYEQSAFILLKTPAMKYADMGFISKYDRYTKLQIYALGQPLVSLEIGKNNICMSLLECMNKSEFNSKMLSQNYPDDILQNILNGEPIMNSSEMVKNSNGFTQKIIKNGLYDIDYSVTNKNISFNDKINKITIKVEKQ